MKNISKISKGFTLVELMVVIAIIAILTGIIVTNFTQAKAKARDAKRISDIANLQLALALFFDRCNGYPPTPLVTTGQGSTISTCPPGITLGNYISKIPTPPTTIATDLYTYAVDATPATDYILRAKLEIFNTALNDDIDDIDRPTWAVTAGVSCDDTASYYYCVGPK